MQNLRRRQQSRLSEGNELPTTLISTGKRRRSSGNNPNFSIFLVLGLFLTSLCIGFSYLQWQRKTNSEQPSKVQQIQVNKDEPKQTTSLRYDDWKEIASNLAALQPSEALEKLNKEDPFGTRAFERDLIQEETRLQRNLNMEEFRNIFSCPVDRITLPDLRSAEKAKAFRDGDEGTFLFFQHLRKAGGTHFCSLAQKNLPKKAVSHYYCMPDKSWNEKGLAGYLHKYSNKEISGKMKQKGHRIAGNEWDQFRLGDDSFFNLPSLFATSFRKPVDRALSQFRFECLEGRGCHLKTPEEYWKRRIELKNVYTYTFSDHRGRLNKAYHGNNKNEIAERVMMLSTALDTVAKFNLVLSMEWLAYASPLVQSALGFQDTTQLTHRVRPHMNQANVVRNDGQEENKMGSASITKASFDAKEYLDPELYKKMSLDLALDEILTDAARRMFLERLVCNDV